MIAGGKIISCAANPVNALLGSCGASDLTPICSYALLPYAREVGRKRYYFTRGGRGAAVAYEDAVLASPKWEAYAVHTDGRVLMHVYFDRVLTAGEQAKLSSAAMKSYLATQWSVSTVDITITNAAYSNAGYPLILNVDTTLVGSTPNNQFAFPAPTTGVVNYELSWGDGAVYRYTVNALKVHTYATPGLYNVAARGNLYTIRTSYPVSVPYADAYKIVRAQVGTLGFTAFSQSFKNCVNLTHVYGPADLTAVTSVGGALSENPSLQSVDFTQWLTPNVTNWTGFLRALAVFNGPLTGLNTSAGTDFHNFLQVCPLFNQPITIDTGNATSMAYFLNGSTSFNQSLAGLNTSKCTDFLNALNGCTAFNSAPMTNFSAATSLQSFMQNCTAFNQPVPFTFNTAGACSALDMLSGCSSFNQSVASWNTSHITNFNGLFLNCTSFKQSLATFTFPASFTLANLCSGCDINAPGTTTNYDNTLIAWAAIPGLQTGRSVNFGTSKYSDAGLAARNFLTATKLWTIVDGGHI